VSQPGGVRDYWVVNLVDRVIEVFRDPAPDPAAPHGLDRVAGENRSYLPPSWPGQARASASPAMDGRKPCGVERAEIDGRGGALRDQLLTARDRRRSQHARHAASGASEDRAGRLARGPC
jgi:hypothetical protein